MRAVSHYLLVMRGYHIAKSEWFTVFDYDN